MENRPIITGERITKNPGCEESLKKEIIYMLEKLDERKLQRVLWYIRKIW